MGRSIFDQFCSRGASGPISRSRGDLTHAFSGERALAGPGSGSGCAQRSSEALRTSQASPTDLLSRSRETSTSQYATPVHGFTGGMVAPQARRLGGAGRVVEVLGGLFGISAQELEALECDQTIGQCPCDPTPKMDALGTERYCDYTGICEYDPLNRHRHRLRLGLDSDWKNMRHVAHRGSRPRWRSVSIMSSHAISPRPASFGSQPCPETRGR